MWPGERQLKLAWAEKYFDNDTEAFDCAERPPYRIPHRPHALAHPFACSNPGKFIPVSRSK
jgi:hypothetical protein